MKVEDVYLPKAEDVELECEMTTGRGIFTELQFNEIQYTVQLQLSITRQTKVNNELFILIN